MKPENKETWNIFIMRDLSFYFFGFGAIKPQKDLKK